ncbi:MAG: Translation initiation factor 2 subunit gamma [Methanosaeta sp. PtaB.Bin039]|nr:MAG: Translation initiation factor 2 subunit gamma [Methanosaeta sp. PtaB.Bin039]OPY44481.1 MAG: Translation initiation factor 2 subunit gamma [Methanosaeta sp. PtaU1.Bin028]HOT07656.1 translation initiation factor IF-2 subunit gamma [Methanotrichaceae archaeon]HQF15924.1 translation initiation factor IF-2 subunit gamma [Methanotrichaceae archaeon]HQI90728.1 translation initiation factor IF-2 subunit gamma [Methanotrichaceae archaeon]
MAKPEVNIGMVGHVDHGKTTLVRALSGVWTDQHSEEIKRGISIRLGYADATFMKCPSCPPPDCFSVLPKCPHCGSDTQVLRTVSFVDSPGHETLMATMLCGAAIMDGAVLVISANEPCPQPQTKEHLMALNIIGIEKLVIVQNKIDLISREEVLDHFNQIKEFVKGTVAENAPIIPISAQQNINVDMVIAAIEDKIPTPPRDLDKPALLKIARSFDVNRPGASADQLVGGVVGGSLSHGVLRVGSKLEIAPGRLVESEGRKQWVPIQTKVVRLLAGGQSQDEVTPGGLIGIGTQLDPVMTKSDNLVGQVLGEPGLLPPVWDKFVMDMKLLERVVGVSDEAQVEPIHTSEPLMLNVGTATTVGVVTSARESGNVQVQLKRPVCAEVGDRVAVSRRIGARWRLIGVGTIISQKKDGRD